MCFWWRELSRDSSFCCVDFTPQKRTDNNESSPVMAKWSTWKKDLLMLVLRRLFSPHSLHYGKTKARGIAQYASHRSRAVCHHHQQSVCCVRAHRLWTKCDWRRTPQAVEFKFMNWIQGGMKSALKLSQVFEPASTTNNLPTPNLALAVFLVFCQTARSFFRVCVTGRSRYHYTENNRKALNPFDWNIRVLPVQHVHCVAVLWPSIKCPSWENTPDTNTADCPKIGKICVVRPLCSQTLIYNWSLTWPLNVITVLSHKPRTKHMCEKSKPAQLKTSHAMQTWLHPWILPVVLHFICYIPTTCLPRNFEISQEATYTQFLHSCTHTFSSQRWKSQHSCSFLSSIWLHLQLYMESLSLRNSCRWVSRVAPVKVAGIWH